MWDSLIQHVVLTEIVENMTERKNILPFYLGVGYGPCSALQLSVGFCLVQLCECEPKQSSWSADLISPSCWTEDNKCQDGRLS